MCMSPVRNVDALKHLADAKVDEKIEQYHAHLLKVKPKVLNSKQVRETPIVKDPLVFERCGGARKSVPVPVNPDSKWAKMIARTNADREQSHRSGSINTAAKRSVNWLKEFWEPQPEPTVSRQSRGRRSSNTPEGSSRKRDTSRNRRVSRDGSERRLGETPWNGKRLIERFIRESIRCEQS